MKTFITVEIETGSKTHCGDCSWLLEPADSVCKQCPHRVTSCALHTKELHSSNGKALRCEECRVGESLALYATLDSMKKQEEEYAKLERAQGLSHA